jgi:protein-S-isoprenylcysteine O-methyltransferase Ste14
MATVALIAFGVYLLVAFVARTVIQIRRTGSSGFKGLGGLGGAEALAGVLFVVALLIGFAAPVLALAGVAEPIDALDTTAVHVAGVVLFLVGLAATFAAQVAMGASWRIGVDPEERTDLVTSGPFALVRNPIFAAMIPTSLGLVLMVPSVVAIVGFVALIGALELQVRVVEEPYLRKVHGPTYVDYCARTGRFFPGVGRTA